jgi:predicted RNA-binding Zn-ribbon protein involved in translation (DUF1610 family)
MRTGFFISAVLIIGVSFSGTLALAATGGGENDNATLAAAEETQTCPQCGFENKAGLNYCIMCGASLKGEAPGEKIHCPQCGAENVKGTKFCRACGYALRPEEAAVRPTSARAPKAGVYFTGGLASYSDFDTGTSWVAGGGLVLPVWRKAGTVSLSLTLSTDVGYSTVNQDLAIPPVWGDFRIGLVPIRETGIFGIGIGHRKIIMPFVGLGGGGGILKWEFGGYGTSPSEGTTVKPLFDIPFGCEFSLTRNFALGARADYLIIPGNIEMEWDIWPYEVQAETPAPNVFLLGGAAYFRF